MTRVLEAWCVQCGFVVSARTLDALGEAREGHLSMVHPGPRAGAPEEPWWFRLKSVGPITDPAIVPLPPED